jgi:hypothetical protein
MKYLLKSKKYQRIVSNFTNNLKNNFNDFVIKIMFSPHCDLF